MQQAISLVRVFTLLSALAVALGLSGEQAAGQASDQSAPPRMASPEANSQAVLAMTEIVSGLSVTVGYSRLLTSEVRFGTIIIGDDTIASASLGPGNSIVLTGLATGSTNIIVLDETQAAILSTTIEVVPVAGTLRSKVTILKGIGSRESYECRGEACERTAIENDEQPQVPFVLMNTADSGSSPSAEPASE